MTDKQPEALRLADALERLDQGQLTKLWSRDSDPLTIAMLRTQHAAIERKDALLRRMVDAWDEPNNGLADCYEVVDAIKQELSQ